YLTKNNNFHKIMLRVCRGNSSSPHHRGFSRRRLLRVYILREAIFLENPKQSPITDITSSPPKALRVPRTLSADFFLDKKRFRAYL
ncbi:MAG TPA: hypothetical protein DIC35_02335, partial [Candidatus Moranbacteria bacterium]|nr:hypothetical protein [Candidatus Moranbacteria bacterium]